MRKYPKTLRINFFSLHMNRYFVFLLSVFFVLQTCLVKAQLQQGDTINLSGLTYRLVSTNLIPNPGFEDGFTGWTDATTAAATLNSTKFTLFNTGGVNNSRYLVGITNESSTSSGSIGTGWNLLPNRQYYFSFQVRYQNTTQAAGNEEWVKVSLTNNRTASTEPRVLLNAARVNGGGQWTKNEFVFTNANPSYSFIVARFRWLNSRLGFDNFELFEVVELVNVTQLQSVINQASQLYRPDAVGASAFHNAIESAKSFLTSTLPAEVTKAINDLNEAIKVFQFQNASPTNPLDVTHWIVNPNFDNNTPEGWRGIGTINHRVVEFFQRTFNMRQAIVGLPAGRYILRAQGFERPRANDGGAAFRLGNEVITSRLYAKANSFSEQSTPFSSLYRHIFTGSGTLNNYLNTMSAAATQLAASNQTYGISVQNILLNQGDTLIIGVRNNVQQSGHWALFDNFRLEYVGAYTNSDLVTALNTQISVAQALLNQKIQQSVREQIQQSILIAQQSVSAQPTVFSDLVSANHTINQAVNAGQLSAGLYTQLQSIMAEALIVEPTLSAARKQSLAAALAVAQTTVNDLTTTTSLLQKAISDISALIHKRIYIPTWMLGNVHDVNNNWSMARSRQSRNWIIFWEPGYGEDPSVLADGNFRVNIDGLLEVAERSFDFYADSLKFITRGRSKTDDYKMIIRLRHTRDWEASGSGVDSTIGLLTLTAWSGQVGGHTLAHEVAHCFQYQVHCDNNDQNGWMYGFGPNASGGNGWWEMCAQWQAFKVFPELQFTDGRFVNYLNTAHKDIMHETPRYDNYFIHDYWTFLHGMDFIGRMWNESRRPEDPVQAYIRMTGINQQRFNDEMWDRAARFATWDIPALRTLGANRINTRPQPRMNNVGNDFWRIDASVCPENYGYNVIRLNPPARATRVSAFFEGVAGMDGFRRNFVTAAGWRFGFVALLNNGTRVYSSLGSPNFLNPVDTVHFDAPDQVRQLWLVVTGAPTIHWRHAWDDDDSNDEQWPYQVKFNQTNLQGFPNVVSSTSELNDQNIHVYNIDKTLYVNHIEPGSKVSVYNVTGARITQLVPDQSSVTAELAPGWYIVKIQSGHQHHTRKVVIH